MLVARLIKSLDFLKIHLVTEAAGILSLTNSILVEGPQNWAHHSTIIIVRGDDNNGSLHL